MTITTFPAGWMNFRTNPYLIEITTGLFVVLTIPFFLHWIFFRSSKHAIPSVLLLGPSDSGKTSLVTLLERGCKTPTHTSQTSLQVKLYSKVASAPSTAKYRSVNDPYSQVKKEFLLVDTPGHVKLRHFALEHLKNLKSLKGIIFFVNAARLRPDDDLLTATAEFLFDVLLALKKRNEKGNFVTEIPVLIAANKMDLFTAMPTAYVQKTLETELTRIRNFKLNGIPDSEIAVGDVLGDGKEDWLGDKESSEFHFSQMNEHDNISIDIVGGNVIGEEPRIENWWGWINDCL